MPTGSTRSTPDPDEPGDGAPAGDAGGDPWVGQVLDGRYRVLDVIGAGGMGAVYRVEHVGMGKRMALKMLHPRLGKLDEAGARFQREAMVGGKIGHPNCVAVSDFGTASDGSFYLVMELLRGESLGEILEREERLPWRRALHIARHVLRGLGHAHDHGIVHRDIKPDNIFVARTDDDPDVAKILDFGIAKLVGEGGSTITQAGITVGTPAYLSPEQAFGGELDGRSDLYSLSIVLYEMLTGRTPFADRDLMGMLTAHAVADIPAIADVAPGARVPAAVEALVRDGLAKAVEDRIGSAPEYVTRIDDLLTGRVATEPGGAVVSGAYAVPSGAYAVPSGAYAAATTPVPGTLTPVPFGSAPTVTTTTLAAAPRWRRVAIAIGGGALAVGVVAALASRGGGDAHAPAAAADATPSASPARRDPPAPEPKPATPEPKPAPAAEPKPATPEPKPPPRDVSVGDALFKAALHDLDKGKTCADRKAAVQRLVELGDKRAIPHLKKARYRMRGGLLGIGDKNTNKCLKAAAEAAMKQLEAATSGS